MTTLHYNKLVPVAFASTTAQAGFPASNLGLETLGRPWYSNGLALETFTITLGAAGFVQSLFLYDVNFNVCTVRKSADGVVFNDIGPANAYGDELGRYRLLCNIGAAGVKAVQFEIPAGAANDGKAYWRAGAGYLFGASAALPVAPSYGYSPRTRRPRISQDLVNGITSQAVSGRNIDRIDFPWDRKFSQSLATLKQQAGQGTVVVSMDLADWPWQMWPLRWLDTEAAENFYKVHKANGKITLTEVV